MSSYANQRACGGWFGAPSIPATLSPWGPYKTLASHAYCDASEPYIGYGYTSGHGAAEGEPGPLGWLLGTSRQTSNEHAIAKFHEHMNPKYDIPKPSFRSWFAIEKFLYTVARRIGTDSYIVFMRHVQGWGNEMDQFQQLHDANGDGADDYYPPFPWSDIWQTWREQLQRMTMNGIIDFVIEGIRTLYANIVWANSSRRVAWKFLKGHYQSALRKFAKYGVLGCYQASHAVLRGQLLYSAAELTYTVCWKVSRPDGPLRAKRLSGMARASGLFGLVKREMECQLLRYMCLALGTVLGLGASYAAFYLAGKDVRVTRFGQLQGGLERPVPLLMMMAAAGGQTIADQAMAAVILPWYYEQRGWL